MRSGLLRRWLTPLVTALALFGALNVLAGLLGGPDRNDLWVRGLGVPPALLTSAIATLVVGLASERRCALGGLLARGAAIGLAAACAADAAGYEALRASTRIGAGWPLAASAVFALVLGAWGLLPAPPGRPPTWPRRMVATGVAGFGLVALHVLSFGATDYRSRADAAVVFGCAVRSDGSPSGALLDRTRTAARLWLDGTVSTLVLSGGRAPGAAISEPECMACIARAEGVPDAALLLDPSGATSAETIAAIGRMAVERGWRRVLFVSHDYHLARLDLLARDLPFEARTVPAVETLPWPGKPLAVLRELAAWTWHFLRTLA